MRTGAAAAGLAALCVAWAAGCALPALHRGDTPEPETANAPVSQPPARLSVVLYGGSPVAAPPRSAPRVELVVDLGRSMLLPAPDGRSRADLARNAATDLLRSLREGTEIAVRVAGATPSDRCTGSERLSEPSVEESREALVRRLSAATPRSEASPADALDEVRVDLERERAAARARVILFSDLEEPCGGDLCAAARRLVASGAWLEVVPLGSAPAPECLAEIHPLPSAPPSPDAAAHPAFRVERSGRGAGSAPVIATGDVGGPAVAVPAGLVRLVVQIDPPEEIGPFRLAPGESARVSVLESGGAGAPSRTWRVERGDEAVGRAFPPPDELPPRN